MKPIILLTAGIEPTKGGLDRISFYKNYADCIVKAGGIPVLAAGGSREKLKRLSERMDGLFLTGGGDIRPIYFGQPEEQDTPVYDDWRDTLEITLCRMFLESEKPILGVCRGIQLLNVACGGTIHQDIGKKLHREHPSGILHPVRTVRGSWWEKEYGETFFVNSFHHQAVDRLGEGLIVSVYEEKSGIIEGIEHKSLPATAVQWHPERMIGKDSYIPGGPDMWKYIHRFVRRCG